MTSPTQLAQTVKAARSVLIVFPTALGDVAMATCLPVALKQANPSLTVSWIIDRALAEVLEDCPVVDQVFPFTRKGRSAVYRALDLMRAAKAARAQQPDFALALRDRFLVMVALGLSGAPVRFAVKGQGLLGKFARTDLLKYEPGVFGVNRLLRLLDPFQLDIKEANPILTPTSEKLQHIRELLAAEGLASGTPYAVAAIGSSRSSKDWPLERHAEVIRWLEAEPGLPTVLVGAAKDKEAADSLQAAAKGQVINLCGKTSLRLLTALLAQARIVYGPDTGPLYVAAAARTPVVILFGPTHSPTLPASLLHQDVVGKEALMANIKPAQVIEALERVLQPSDHQSYVTS